MMHFDEETYSIQYDNVILGKNVLIHPFSVIGKPPQVPNSATTYKPKLNNEKTVIGDNCVIGANAVIYQGCTIGESTLIGDGTRLRDRVYIGKNCIIGMGTKVGPKTIIQDFVKIMDLCNIAGNTVIESYVFIAQGTMFANDKYMGRKDAGQVENYEELGPTIRKFATIGMNSTILPGVVIGENAIVAAGAIVADCVEPKTLVASPKARFIRRLNPSEIKV